jgi:hypothetical protein
VTRGAPRGVYCGTQVGQLTPVNTATTPDELHDRPASPLLGKARRLGLEVPLDLERLAIARGCDYYDRDLGQRMPPLGEVPLTNAELAIALLSPAAAPTAREIRLAAALLGAADVGVEEIVRLATQEHCTAGVRYIAECGRRYEPENPHWATLLERLPSTEPPPERWPHPTRFIEMTGITRGKVGLVTRWIRPYNPLST